MNAKIYELVVEADSNDADYVTEITAVSEEFIGSILPVIQAIKDCEEEYNWPNHTSIDSSPSELYSHIDPSLLNKFRSVVPYIEGGVHTITSIVYYPMPTKTVLL